MKPKTIELFYGLKVGVRFSCVTYTHTTNNLTSESSIIVVGFEIYSLAIICCIVFFQLRIYLFKNRQILRIKYSKMPLDASLQRLRNKKINMKPFELSILGFCILCRSGAYPYEHLFVFRSFVHSLILLFVLCTLQVSLLQSIIISLSTPKFIIKIQCNLYEWYSKREKVEADAAFYCVILCFVYCSTYTVSRQWVITDKYCQVLRARYLIWWYDGRWDFIAFNRAMNNIDARNRLQSNRCCCCFWWYWCWCWCCV